MATDLRSQLIDAAKDGIVSWEDIARTFIVQASSSQCEDVIDELTDNEGFNL
jgi:hypothetical protein